MRGLSAMAALGLLLLGGCGVVGMEEEPLPPLDFEEYVQSVQPILGFGCGNPSCHGDARRPLSIYSPQQYRRNSADIFTSSPLTEGELRENYERARSFAVDYGQGPLLLTKPLAEDVGGARHLEGGDIFYSIEDRDYRILKAWIDGGGGNADKD